MSHSLHRSSLVDRCEDTRTTNFVGSLAVYLVVTALLVVALLAASFPTLVAGLVASFGLVSVALRSH